MGGFFVCAADELHLRFPHYNEDVVHCFMQN